MNCALTSVKVPTELVQRYSTLAHLTGHDSNYYMQQAFRQAEAILYMLGLFYFLI